MRCKQQLLTVAVSLAFMTEAFKTQGELSVNSDVDAVGLDRPDGRWNKEADLAGEMSVLVLLHHLVLQCALDGVEAARLAGHQDQHVHICSIKNKVRTHNSGPQAEPG